MDLNQTIRYKQLLFPSMEKEVIMEIKQSPSWMDPIKAFIEDRELTDDQFEAKKSERRAPSLFHMEESSYASPLQIYI